MVFEIVIDVYAQQGGRVWVRHIACIHTHRPADILNKALTKQDLLSKPLATS